MASKSSPTKPKAIIMVIQFSRTHALLLGMPREIAPTRPPAHAPIALHLALRVARHVAVYLTLQITASTTRRLARYHSVVGPIGSESDITLGSHSTSGLV